MNKGQQKFVKKTLRSVLLGALAIFAATLAYRLFKEWISSHRDTVKWAGFALLVIVSAFARAQGPLPSREERHRNFNRLFDENPWAKIYLVVYGIAIAIGVYYVLSHHIDVAEKFGFFWLFGAVLMLMGPAFLIQLKEKYDEAGEEE